MELRHIRYFLAVAEELNFTRAAARMGIGQPPLSQQIKDLENEVGVRLFHRIPQGAELTEAGQAFLEKVKGVPDLVQDAVQSAQRAGRGETGTLNLGMTGTAALQPYFTDAIRRFRRSFLDVELTLEEANSVGLINGLMDGRLDVAILRPNAAEPEELQKYQLLEEPLVIALPEAWASSDSSMALVTLRDAPLVLTPRKVGITLHDEALRACRDAGFEPVIGQSAPQIASIMSMVAAELGFSLVPASMQQLQVQGVVFRAISGEAPLIGLTLAHRRIGASKITLNFVQLLRQLAPTYARQVEPLEKWQ